MHQHNQETIKSVLSFSLNECDFTNPESIEQYAKQLEGMTFRQVLNLGIVPEGVEREYNNKNYKGGMGTLIEERFFGYKANNEQEADFQEAGVELKASPLNMKKDGDYSVGERLVLTMIPFDKPINDDFYSSHVWKKSEKILLVYYERDHELDRYDQTIKYVKIITPSSEDLKIIKEDYRKIATIIKAGKAEDLSESLTSYLGACTKGADGEDAARQYYPPHTRAKKRAFCFKRSYMDYVLHERIMGTDEETDSIIKDSTILDEMSFEDYVLSLISPHIGKTDKELCTKLDLEYTGNKAQWTKITYALLGVRGSRAEEFEKANISVRTVRIEENGSIRESLSLDTFKFKEIVNQEWEDSPLHDYFEETRFLFIPFKKEEGRLILAQPRFWSMPIKDIEGPLRECWEKTREVIVEGVRLEITIQSNGKPRIKNNLPKEKDNEIAHVRPHAQASAYYLLEDGIKIGNIERDGDELPDGRIMTKQSFWLNDNYVYEIISFGD